MDASSLDTLLSSFALVAVSEMGDKTQLLSFSLAARFKRPWPIMAGIFVATIANHFLAAWVGVAVTSLVSEKTISWILAVMFLGCGFWALIPDKLDEDQDKITNHGAFFTTCALFFFAEMGDKTQLATIGLGARFTDVTFVTIGTTLGMMATNALAVFLGDRIAGKVQMKWIRVAAALVFFAFAIGSAVQALQMP